MYRAAPFSNLIYVYRFFFVDSGYWHSRPATASSTDFRDDGKLFPNFNMKL